MWLSDTVKSVLRTENISVTELEKMLRLAGPLTHPKGNRRFHHWGFKVVGNDDVLDMFKIEARPTKAPLGRPRTAHRN